MYLRIVALSLVCFMVGCACPTKIETTQEQGRANLEEDSENLILHVVVDSLEEETNPEYIASLIETHWDRLSGPQRSIIEAEYESDPARAHRPAFPKNDKRGARANVRQVAGRLADYFQELANISKANKPCCTNAAHNGWVSRTHRSYKKGRIKDLGVSLDAVGEARRLERAYHYFYESMRRNFKSHRRGHSGGFYAKRKVVLEKWVGPIFQFVAAILGKDDKDGKNIAKAAKSIAETLNETAGTTSHGVHANGWWSVRTVKATKRPLRYLQKNPVTGDRAKAVADVLERSFELMASLRTKDHDPWLRPETQIAFECICRATSEALRRLSR